MSDALIAEVRKKSSSLSDPHMILFCEKTRPLCFCVCVSECSIGYIDRIDIDAVNILAHAVNILALLSDLLELLSDLLELIFPTERTAPTTPGPAFRPPGADLSDGKIRSRRLGSARGLSLLSAPKYLFFP